MACWACYRFASPKHSVRVRLAAMEAMARLSLLGQGAQAGEGSERALEWTLAVVDREGERGHLGIKYWALKVRHAHSPPLIAPATGGRQALI